MLEINNASRVQQLSAYFGGREVSCQSTLLIEIAGSRGAAHNLCIHQWSGSACGLEWPCAMEKVPRAFSHTYPKPPSPHLTPAHRATAVLSPFPIHGRRAGIAKHRMATGGQHCLRGGVLTHHAPLLPCIRAWLLRLLLLAGEVLTGRRGVVGRDVPLAFGRPTIPVLRGLPDLLPPVRRWAPVLTPLRMQL